MTDREALVRAIIENPDDDAPRLVYADWLDEQGRDEQAEWIRAEYQYRQAKVRWEGLQATIDSDWAKHVFPANGLVLCGYPPVQKIAVIKLLREIMGLGLAQAKAVSESLPARIGGTWDPVSLDLVEKRFAAVEARTERRFYVIPDC